MKQKQEVYRMQRVQLPRNIFFKAPSVPDKSIKAGTVHAGFIEPTFRTNAKGWAKPLPTMKWYTVQERTDSILRSYWHDPKLWNGIAKEQWIKNRGIGSNSTSR